MADYGIRMTADGSGLVAETAKADEKLKKFNQTMEEVAKSSKTAGDESARYVQRLKEEADTLGMTTAQAERYRAENMKLTEAQRQSVDASLATVEAHNKGIAAGQALARTVATVTVAVVAYAAASVVQVKNIIDEAAQLHNLSQSYGMSTQALSAYRYQMSLAGVTGAEFEGAMRNLSQRVQEAQQGTGRGAQLFAAFGGELQRAAQSGAPLEKLLPMLAEQLSQYANGTNKTALAADALGAAVGPRMLVALNKGAAGIREAAKEAAEFNRIIGPEMAKNADEFNSGLTRLNALWSAQSRILTADLLPSLNKYLEQLIEGRKIFGGWWEAMKGAGLTNPFKSVEGQQASARDDLQRLRDYQKNAANAPGFDADVTARDIAASEKRLAWFNLMQRQQVLEKYSGMDMSDQVSRARRGAPAPVTSGEERGTGKTAQGRSDFDSMMRQAEQMEALAVARTDSTEKLTEAQTALYRIQALYEAGLTTLNSKEFEALQQRLASTSAIQSETIERDKAAKAADEATRAYNAGVEAQWKSVASIEENNEKLAQHNREIGLSKEQIDLNKRAQLDGTIALLENNIALAESFDSQAKWVEIAKARLEALKETARLLGEGAIAERTAAQAKEASGEWQSSQKSMWDSIDRTAHDTFVSILNGGKDTFTRLRDTLKNTVYDLLYQMSVRPFLINVVAAVTGTSTAGSALTGGGGMLGGGSMGGGGFGNLGGLGNILGGSGLSGNLASGFSSVFGGSSFTAAAAGDAFMPAMLGAEGLGSAGIGSMLGAGFSSGFSWSPIIGGAMMAMQGNVAGGIGSALGGIAGSYFGPIGTAVGSFLGGKIGGMFGGGEKKIPHAKGSLAQDESGELYIRFKDVAGIAREEQNKPEILAMNEQLNDPRLYDQDMLREMLGRVVQGPRGGPGTSTLAKLNALLAPARASAEAYSAKFNAQLGGMGALQASLGGYVSSMSVSEYLSPEQRLAGARSMYDTALAAAGSGDAAASQALPGLANQLLGAGRTMYASGTQFQDMFTQVNNEMARVVAQTTAANEALLAELPAAFREANEGVISSINKQTAALLEALQKLNSGLRGLGNSGSPTFSGA